MSSLNLEIVASAILSRATQQGYVLPGEIRMELTDSGQSPKLWRKVVSFIGPLLEYRHGRYYPVHPPVSRLQHEQNQLRLIREKMQEFISSYRSEKASEERRREGRARFARTALIRNEDEKEQTVLLQDLSPSGVRLIADRSLLGRKISIFLPSLRKPHPPVVVKARVLWCFEIAEGLYKNGGNFLELNFDESAETKKNS